MPNSKSSPDPVAPAGIRSVDPTAPAGPAKRLLMKVSNTGFGRKVGINLAAKVDPLLLRASGGRVATTAFFPVVTLISKGRKSGQERQTPLVYFTRGEEVILIASSFGREKNPAWYYNATANPQVELLVKGHRLPYAGPGGRGRGAPPASRPRRAAVRRLRRLPAANCRYPRDPGSRPQPPLTTDPTLKGVRRNGPGDHATVVRGLRAGPSRLPLCRRRRERVAPGPGCAW